jgi:septum formation protein
MFDLEQFWANILSEDTGLITSAWASLDDAEREAVIAQLNKIAADLERHPDQRHAAKVALSALAPVPRILLASGSPRRRELVRLLGLPFDLTSANVDEAPHPGEEPPAMVIRLSREKAQSARLAHTPTDAASILVTADTTVSLDGVVLGKPADAGEARAMLTQLRGRSHQVFTAVTLVDRATGRQVTDLASTDVPMRDYGDDEIDAYIATGDPFDKAGSYAIQHGGFNPVEAMRGCYANVVGLPLCHLTRSLRALGVEPPVDVPAACQAHLNYECPVYQSILKRDA